MDRNPMCCTAELTSDSRCAGDPEHCAHGPGIEVPHSGALCGHPYQAADNNARLAVSDAPHDCDHSSRSENRERTRKDNPQHRRQHKQSVANSRECDAE